MTDILDSLAKPPPPPSELDELMSRDPLELSALDIDKIIAYQRAARARREAGVKAPRAKRGVDPNALKVTLDLAALGLTKPKPTAPQGGASQSRPSPISTGGGFRRRI